MDAVDAPARQLSEFLNPPAAPDESAGNRPFTPQKILLFAALSLLVTAYGSYAGFKIFEGHKDTAHYYQHYFEPALNLACTGRFARFEHVESADAFLKGEVDSFLSCDDIKSSRATERWTPFDNQSTYLYLLTASVWKVFGISWANMAFVAGIFSGLFACSLFWFLRSFSSNSLVSAAAVFGFYHFVPIASAIPHIRDFSKAAFILMPLALAVFAITRPVRPTGRLWLLAAAGLVIALGRGFRPDVFIVVPIIIAGVLALLPTLPREDFKSHTLRPLAGFVLALFVGSLPLFLSSAFHAQTGSLSPHFFNLGYAEHFYEAHLQMDSPGYSTSRFYDDNIISEHAYTYLPNDDPDRTLWNSRTYDSVSWQAFREFTFTTPHDAFMRAFYALKVILSESPYAHYISGLTVLILFLLSSLVFPRRGMVFLIISGSLIVIATLQFDKRHYFHLLTLTTAVMLMFAGALQTAAQQAMTQRRLPLDVPALRGLGILLVGIAALAAVLDPLLARAQSTRLERIQSDYESRAWFPVDATLSGSSAMLNVAPEGDQAVMMRLVRTANVDARLDGVKPVSLSPTNGSELDISGQESLLKMSEAAGYQAISDPIRTPAQDSGGPPRIFLYADIEVRGSAVAIGPQTPDHSRWIASPATFPPGRFRGVIEFPHEPDDAAFRLVLEKPAPVAAELEIHAMLALPDNRACLPGSFIARQVYRTKAGTDLVGWPEVFDPAQSVAYYFPATFSTSTTFSGVTLEGSGANCISDFEWSPITSGAPHIELMLSDGVREKPERRGDLGTVLEQILFETPDKPKKPNG